MKALQGKKILVAVTASIAAYKSAVLVRLLKKEGALVKVILSKDAQEFITPLTLATLSENKVISDFVSNSGEGEWNNHVELGLWADVMLIAPATANTLAKCANGQCDNVLVASYLSARCKVFFAPAMDLDMYQHGSTLANLARLKSYGNIIIDAETGFLASGLEGKGRMAEPETIVTILANYFSHGQDLAGKKVMLTAGPTFEFIDPVRFIGNMSTGKMGYAIAAECAARGAAVTLISGPCNLAIPTGVEAIHVTSADEMFDAAMQQFPDSDIAILSAAVADYKPANLATRKLKKADNLQQIELIENKDILKTLGTKKTRQLLIGFALETNDALANGQKKLEQKNLDFIVINTLADAGAGFGHDTNKITILDKENNLSEFELKSKAEVAKDIVNTLVSRLQHV